VAIAFVAYLVAGVAALGTVTFVVAFAVFHFPWPAVWAIIATGLAVTALVPIALGVFDELWFLTLITAAVSGASVLIRVAETHQADQAHLRTRLALSDERSRVARDVHDVLGHSLTAVILKVELCQRLLDGVDTAASADGERIEVCRGQLAELDSISRSALAEIRSTVGGLRATNLADEVTVARTVLADAGVDLLVTGDVADVPEGQRPMLAWVVREAVTNVVRHAKAERCHIALAPTGPVLLRVTDDGVGLAASGEGNGLRGLRERVAAAGGLLRIESGSIESGSVDSGDLESTGTDSTGGTRIEVAV
jgi:two-component system sensor histidine kinase DesK